MILHGVSFRDPAYVAQCDKPVGCPAFFLAIRKECERTGRPEGYHSDVFRWDRLYPGGPCIWVLRDLGTHIFPLRFESEAEIRGCGGKILAHCVQTFGNDPWCYHWDGMVLRQMTQREASDLLDDAAEESRKSSDFKKDKSWILWG